MSNEMSDTLVKRLRHEWKDIEEAVEIAEEAADLIEQQAERIRALEEGLRYYRDECSGAEPSLSVFNRMVDTLLAEGRK